MATMRCHYEVLEGEGFLYCHAHRVYVVSFVWVD